MGKVVTTLGTEEGYEGVDCGAVTQKPTNASCPMEMETVPLGELLPAVDTPRLDGDDVEHVRVLASSETVLPPILVHRGSRRVIDGSHRLKAARLRAARAIQVAYFDGSNEEAFVAAVKANTTHGLPLSLADRKAAAARILSSYPHWSDRAIAKITGLAAKTIAAIRHPTEEAQQLDARVGSDSRVRPLNGSVGRLRAAEVIRSKPNASLREIAYAAAVSPMTARDVRDRLRRGAAPTLPETPRPQTTNRRRPRSTARSSPAPVADPTVVLGKLRRDPSLRQTETGRMLLRRLDVQVRALASQASNVDQVPPHCMYLLIELAQAIASRWLAHADELERRLDSFDLKP